MPRKVVVTFRDGKTNLKVEGVSGPSCQQATKFLSDRLGTVTAEGRTEEFYQTEGIQETARENLQEPQ